MCCSKDMKRPKLVRFVHKYSFIVQKYTIAPLESTHDLINKSFNEEGNSYTTLTGWL